MEVPEGLVHVGRLHGGTDQAVVPRTGAEAEVSAGLKSEALIIRALDSLVQGDGKFDTA
jgi:hypothetical protein